MADKKKFGLIMTKKCETVKVNRNSIFNDNSDDDDKCQQRPKIPQKKIDLKSNSKLLSIEDPSIYQYDDIYDEMKQNQTQVVAPKEKKNSRYIETLLKAADKRKKEYERRIDKKIHVERQKEGDKFKDKEAFVTSSYKKKMQEQEEEEERERREGMLNDMMDVTKQKDLSGFYKHFLNQTVGEEQVPQFGERQIKKERVSDNESSDKFSTSYKKKEKSLSKQSKHSEIYDNIDQDSDNVEIDDNEGDVKSDTEEDDEKRKMSSDCKILKQTLDTAELEKHHSHKRNSSHYRKKINYEKGTSSSDDYERSPKKTKSHHSHKHKQSKRTDTTHLRKLRHDSLSSADDSDEQNEKSKETYKHNEIDTDTEKHCDKTTNEKKAVVNFAKRTVGDIFTEAQAKYFQRLESRKTKI